jgi:hypothetical protein
MKQKKLEKVHLVRVNDFKKEDYDSLISFLETIYKKEKREKIFISYNEHLTIPSSELKEVKIKMSDVEELIHSPYFSNLYKKKEDKDKLRSLAKAKIQKCTSWNFLFKLCNEFRSKHKEINPEEQVIILTNTTNKEEYFSALDDKTGKNGFVHTDLWDFFLPGYDKIYPISYEIIGLIVHSKMGCTYTELAETLSHQSPLIGCISDLCDNKTEINIKIRTGDICENCLERIKKNLDFDDVFFLLKFLDEIRNETLRTLRYYNINKKVSDIKLIRHANGKTDIEFVDYKKILSLKGPLHQALYLYLLQNKNGIATEIDIIEDEQLEEIARIYQKEARGRNKNFNTAYQTILKQFDKNKIEVKSNNKFNGHGQKSIKKIQLKIYSVIATINTNIKDCVKGKQPTEEYKIQSLVNKKLGYTTYKVQLKSSKIHIVEN